MLLQKTVKTEKPNFSVLILLSLGHLVTDMAQGALPALLPTLKQAFALNYALTSLLVLMSNIASSVIQPFFGYIADRRSARWLLPLGCLLAGLGEAATGRIPWFSLLLLAVTTASIGVAAYHPEGSRVANLASGVRKGRGMAIFSVGGNLGFGLGSIYMAWLLSKGGLKATIFFILPSLIIFVIFMFYWRRLNALRDEEVEANVRGKSQALQQQERSDSKKRIFAAFSLLLLYIIFRTWLHAGLYTYVPLYYTDYLQGDPHSAGYIVSVFLLAGAVGTLLGGPLTDVLGAPKVMATSMALLIPLLYFFSHVHNGIAFLILLALIGATLISTFSTTVVLGQQLIPHRKGLASGFTMGFGVGMGGVGVTLLGVLADYLGVPAVFKVLNILAAGGFILALLLIRYFPWSSKTMD